MRTEQQERYEKLKHLRSVIVTAQSRVRRATHALERATTAASIAEDQYRQALEQHGREAVA
jgi:hypothetical protein